MTDTDAFMADWRRFRANNLPLAHTLKWSDESHWLRLHVLPEGKRYADSDQAAQTVSHRAKCAGDEILKTATRVWLVLAVPRPNPDLDDSGDMETVDLALVDPDGAAALGASEAAWDALVTETARSRGLAAVWTFPYKDEDCDYTIHAGQTHWPDRRDVDLLRRIADDEIDRIFWMSGDTGEIFAPYDGGIDLILSSAARKADLSRRYADWASARPDGL